MTNNSYKILLTGGGTGGSVSPLLAIVEALRKTSAPDIYDFRWLGGRGGIEENMVKRSDISFEPIHNGKLRRYWSWRNLIDPWLILFGLIESFRFMRRWRPELIITAGSYISVPVVWAGRLLKIPIIVHQQDLRPGLANQLMSPFATIITVTFEKSLADFKQKAQWFGNPIRESFIASNADGSKPASKQSGLPLLLVLGGGTGAEALNVLIEEAAPLLAEFCQVLHVTGPNKNTATTAARKHYRAVSFLNEKEMAEAYASADLVLTRAGIGTLSELAYLGKPALIVPMPATHQEDNAEFFRAAHAAAVLDQRQLTPELLATIIKESINDKDLLAELSSNIRTLSKKDSNQKFVEAIKKLTSKA
jgi:UDP-N-acetylglucosamine--N-acetylmuramyl-(pentapeptide) pyrophosphoryl-undecaprenol N-acetylglucosamine transferase